MKKSLCIALILASGVGNRFKSNTPKQFKKLNSKPLYLYTLETVLKSKVFKKIEIKVQFENINKVKNDIKNYSLKYDCEIEVSEGGNERIENIKTFMNSIIDLKKPYLNIAIFDANRPFTPIDLILKLKESCEKTGAACPSKPVIDGCCYVEKNQIISIPDKNNLYSLQTPEFININYFQKCMQDLDINTKFMGIAELVIYSKNKIDYVKSDERSFKVTEPRDWVYAEFLVKSDLSWD